MGKKKGKAQNGRAKQKQKAQGSAPRSTPRSRHVQQQTLDSDWDDDAHIQFRGFSQKAPSSTATPRSAAARLRHQAISFVTAGVNSPTIQKRTQTDPVDFQIALDDTDEDEDWDDDDDDVDDSHILTNIVLNADIETSKEGIAKMQIDNSTGAMELEADEANAAAAAAAAMPTATGDTLFFVDTVGDSSLTGSVQNVANAPVMRAPSPAPSNSSEEVVVFHGRNKATTVDDPVLPPHARSVTAAHTPSFTPTPIAQSTTAAETYPSSSFVPSPSAPAAQGWGKQPSQLLASRRSDDVWRPAPAVPYWRASNSEAVSRPDLDPSATELEVYEVLPPKQSKVQFAEDAGQEEVNNTKESTETLQANWKKVLGEKKKKLKMDVEDDTSSKASKSSSRKKKRGRKNDNRSMRAPIVSDDDNSEAAYDDYMKNLMAQLDDGEEPDEENDILANMRTVAAIAGPSMVVDGKEVDDGDVLPQNKKLTARELQNMEMNEDSESSDEGTLNPDFDELSDSMGESDLEDDLESIEREQWEDEKDLRQRRIERLDDESIARLLAKQEELGMGSDEILIENGDYPYPSDEGYGDVDAARVELNDITNSSFGRGPNKHGMARRSNNRSNFPNASAMADAVDQYGDNGFDIMDFDRPSLRPTKKGRKGLPPPELEMLSDEELRDDLTAQWQKDKSTKRQKKLEREELRAAGMLGSAGRKGKADLSQKYSNGMSMKDVWTELRAFMENDDLRERAFPPMDKIDRKKLHQVAMALDLNSKSQGTGMKRFPIVYKTRRTKEFSPDLYYRFIQAADRGGLGYSKGSADRIKAGTSAGRGGRGGGGGGRGGGVAAATVRHGEVVGAGAAEISSSSFGHKMLEKYGWSKGKALGKDGEGRLVPVEQRMRVGTAGLG
ncbi:hypothetical protein DOTSEDRAFT_82684 [Lecanosticta acicola]|uniref:Protein SQS1 n=1 Tax=Lecanosticta acicola TaxID=111012 RepID=A0AAI9E9Y8_9PEZI|nr:hypothetical protein DOTSEDRAFT_82684 [Lecanosticta acicola]